MTSSNGNIFRVTGALCGEFTGPGEFPTQRPVTRSFDVFFDLRLNKRWSKQPWGWWFETPSWSLWRQCNEYKGWDTLAACKWRLGDHPTDGISIEFQFRLPNIWMCFLLYQADHCKIPHIPRLLHCFHSCKTSTSTLITRFHVNYFNRHIQSFYWTALF